MSPVTISIPHQLGRAEARRRIEGGFVQLVAQVPGGAAGQHSWAGDRLTFGVKAMGQSFSGVVDVGDTAVTMEIELPGWLGSLASTLKGRLASAGKLLLTRK